MIDLIPKTALPFMKMHGLGNDFVVIDARMSDDPMTPGLAKAIADRHRGVGFDQLAVIRPGTRGATADIVFWNADGGVAGACGNATRCIAEALMREQEIEALTLRTERGALNCRRRPDGVVEVDMGPPKLEWTDIPLRDASDTIRIDVKLGPIDDPVLWGPSAVNMGNPHAVFFVDDVERMEVEKLGPMLEHHPMFPERANIGFAQVLAPDEIRLRVWERGVGLTLACGSGACAAVVAGVRRKLIEPRATVRLDGGALEVEWSRAGGVLMAGPTAMVFAGALDPSFLAALDRTSAVP